MLHFDPYAALEQLDRSLDRTRRSSVLAMDAVRDDDEVVIYFDVPGVALDDIEVSVEKNELKVRALRRWDDGDQKVIAQERAQGSFERSIFLGDALDADSMTADLDNGVLTIRVPVAPSTRARSIEIGVGGKTAESSSSAGGQSTD